MDSEQAMERLHGLTRRYFRTAPSKINETFSSEEIEILKQAGIICKVRRGKRYGASEAAVMGAAFTALDRR